jgi:hypothetical protein
MRRRLGLLLLVVLLVGCTPEYAKVPPPTTTSLPFFRWEPYKDNEALAACIVDMVGIEHLSNWRLYRVPAAFCFAEINPVALLHRDLDAWASCIDAAWSWEPDWPKPSTFESAAGGIEETCFHRGP